MACALASSTDTPAELWFGLLQVGAPFSALQERAARMVSKRVEFRRPKGRKSA